MPTRSFTCLAIETATESASVALLEDEAATVREARGEAAPSRSVYRWIVELLADAGIGLRQLDCLAFGAGPGSFTGVRVATSVAQALGFSLQLPICPVSTLAALAAGALRTSDKSTVACCLDARMGQVYFAVYRRDPDLGVVALREDALLDPGNILLEGLPGIAAVGSGWLAYPELRQRLPGSGELLATEGLPSARDVAALAAPIFHAGRTVAPDRALPNYLRDQVASLPGSRR